MVLSAGGDAKPEAGLEKCRLAVWAPEGAWHGSVDVWTSYVALAALAAEPESLAELAEAMRRYLPMHQLVGELRPIEEDGEVAVDQPWLLVDLRGRTVLAGAGFELPEPHGAYEPEPDEHIEGFPIVWLDTPADWLIRPAGEDWRAVVATRAAARAAAVRVDTRAVLYGPPLLDHLAASVLAAVTAGNVEAERERDVTRSCHAQWLLTARADLNGATPRDVLLARRPHIERDLEHRSHQWSRQGHAVPALPPDSAAYRFGGFGTIEVVLYFDLVRALLAEAWASAMEDPRPTPPELARRLSDFRKGWLHQPNEVTGPDMTPAELIESERRRMPITSDGSDLDDDCPICQAMAEGECGPSFVWFDGHHLELEGEFAFSLWETHEEWEREQEEYRKFAEEMDRKDRERAARGEGDPLADSAWQTSFVNWEELAGPDASREGALLALSFPLAELTSDIQERPEGMHFCRALTGSYARLRTSQDAVAADSAAQELRECLENVGRDFRDLTAKCADLQSHVDEVLQHHG